MAKTNFRLICSIIMILGFFALSVADSEAKSNFAPKKKMSSVEENVEPAAETTRPNCPQPPPDCPVADANCAHCPEPQHCCPAKERSLLKRIGARINCFLTFGCRLNYGLNNWLLGDKCDTGLTYYDNP